ncbi:MAG: S9 family peptidase [Kofleriaceae bacterium]|nr:S9 family peptidase [Kofleriaceae bacterium]
MRIGWILFVAACSSPVARTTTPAPPPDRALAVAAAAEPHTETLPASGPSTRVDGVVDRQFGIEVPDPYRWMENGDTGEGRDWLRAQGEQAAEQLAALPLRDKLYTRVRELGLGVAAIFSVQVAGKRKFHFTFPAGAQLAKLAVREPDGKTRILVDPEKLSSAGTHVSLHAWNASPDGKYLAYVLSTGGGEVGVLHIMDVATGQDLPDQIERIWGEGSANWLPDGKSFFYSQMAVPEAGVDPMTNMTALWHQLGQPVAKDVVILDHAGNNTWKLAPEEFPGLWSSPGSEWVVADSGGAHSEVRIGVAKLSELDKTGRGLTPWRIVADYTDGVEAAVVHGDRLYLKTYKDAPNRKVISVPLANPDLKNARVEIPEDPTATLGWIPPARDGLYVVHQRDGLARLSRMPWKGGKLEPIKLPYEGWTPDVATDHLQDGITFQVEGWLRTGTYYTYDPKTKKLSPTGLASTTTADTSQLVADEVEATSADGTKVPLSILHRRDIALDGSHPTILYAYGGYGAVEHPGFSSSRVAWVERGGVYAIAHVRGGGEKGRKWQDDGSRDKKMNGVRDFIACAQYLVDKKFTAPGKLAAHGISMGGVLVGRALTERPDLFAVVQLAVGIVNPLRILAAENGANQKTELGDPSTEAGYKQILEMDPYAHVAPNTAYPAVIFTVGLNDHRVAPWMTSKMAARLRASTTSGKPIMIRVDADAGHGIGSTRDQAFAEKADVWGFMLDQMGER